MSDFKVGDRVVCVDISNTFEALELNREYTVIAVDDDPTNIYVSGDAARPGCCAFARQSRFKLAEPKVVSEDKKEFAIRLKKIHWKHHVTYDVVYETSRMIAEKYGVTRFLTTGRVNRISTNVKVFKEDTWTTRIGYTD